MATPHGKALVNIRIKKNHGVSPISRTPMKESEMSSNRQYHRKVVREALTAKKKYG